MVRAIFGISHPLGFSKFQNYHRFTQAISKFSKIHSGNLSQIIRPNMWLLLLIGFRGKKRPNERTVWHIDTLTISFHQFSLRLTNTLLWKLHQRRNENDKNTNFFMKNKKCQKSIFKHKLAFFTLNSPSLTRDVTCFKL